MEETVKRCSFCGREITDTNILIEGLNGYICDECAKLANKISLESEKKTENVSLQKVPKPKEVKAFLDQYVIGQDRVKQRIAVAVYNHYKRLSAKDDCDVNIDKSNILIVGPTGTGKTYIANTIAKMLDVPFAISDATSLTEAGYVGDDVESVLVRLLQNANYDIERAERGIVFIDEIDKIATKGSGTSITRDVNGEGVQQGLLKLLEGSVVMCPPKGGRKHPEQQLVPINTKNILFICGGAFVGLSSKIQSRCNKSTIGFNKNNDKTENIDKINPLSKLSTLDLKNFGLIPEIIGRLPILTYTDELDKDALIKIMTEPKNAIIKQYKALFAMDGISINFNNNALEYIAEVAMKTKIGARGLRGILEDVMNDLMYNTPSENIQKITITLDYVKEKLSNMNLDNDN